MPSRASLFRILSAVIGQADLVTSVAQGVSKLFKSSTTGPERLTITRDLLAQMPDLFDLSEVITNTDLVNDAHLRALMTDLAQAGYDLNQLRLQITSKEALIRHLIAEVRASKGTGGRLQPGQ